jgi:hypothetical protein
MFDLELIVGDKTYKTKGETIEEALKKLDNPKSIKSGVLKVSNGKKTETHKIRPLIVNRLKENHFVQAFWAKRIGSVLK